MSVDLCNLFFIIMAVLGMLIVALVLYYLTVKIVERNTVRLTEDEEGRIQFVDYIDDGGMEEDDDIFVIDVGEEMDVTQDFWILNTN